MSRQSLHGLALALLSGAIACTNAGKEITLPSATYSGVVQIHFFRDLDANGTGDLGEPNFVGVRAALLSANGSDTLKTALSDADGNVRFTDLPFGTYRYVFFRNTIGDSVQVFNADTVTPLRVLARLDSLRADRDVAIDYPRLTIAQARASAPGKRVSIRGTVVSPFQAFREAESYIRDATGTLRITAASHVTGRAGNDQGDSIVVIGLTGTNLGQPVLIGGIFNTFIAGPPPNPRAVTVAQARTAIGGTIDAAFVQVSGAIIIDTAMVLPDYRVTIGDGANPSDRVEVLIDQLVTVTHSSYKPGVPITVRGVLKPKGDGTWVIMPRIGIDVTFP